MSGSAEFELLRVQRLVETEFQLSTSDASLAVVVLETDTFQADLGRITANKNRRIDLGK